MAVDDTTVISDYSNFLKEWYIPRIEQQRRHKNVFLDDRVVKFDHEHVAGEYAYIPVEFQSYVGIGSRLENTAMPIPDAGQYDRTRISLVTNFAVMQLSIQLMRKSEGDRASFNPALAQITQTLISGWLRDLNRQVLGDARGYLFMMDASCTDGDTGAKDIDNAWGISNTDAGSNGNGDMFVSENQRINLFNGDAMRTDGGNDDDGVIRISAYTRGSGDTEATITMDDSGTSTDGDYGHLDGNKHASSGAVYEANGLMLLDDDGTVAGTVQNISSTTRPDWVAAVYYGESSGTVEALTRSRMNQPWKDILKRADGKVDFLFCGVDTEETYLELADSMSLVTNQVKLDAAGNWEGPSFRGSPIISDPVYPETRLEYIDLNAIAIYENGKADWLPGDVGILQKVAGYANYVAEYMWMWNFGTSNRSKLGSLRDIELVV